MRLIFSLVLLLPLLAFAGDASQEIAEATQWFRTFPWPDLKGKPYVEVVGQDSRVVERGFLLSETSNTWEILPDTPLGDLGGLASSPGRFLTRHLSKEIFGQKLRVKQLHETVQELISAGSSDFDERRVFLRHFTLARFCELTGAADLALQLDRSLPPVPTYNEPSLKIMIQSGVARSLIADAYFDLSHRKIPREQCVSKFERVARYCPDSPEGIAAARLARQIRKIVAKESASSEAATRPIAAMAVDEKIDEYIYLLKDQTGSQIHSKGFCDIFQVSGDLLSESGLSGKPVPAKERTPAQELADLGMAAVPRLIEALADERPTRAVGRSRMVSDCYVLTVADCAEAILSQMAGRSFFCLDENRLVYSGAKDRPMQIADVRRRATEWFRSASVSGEYALLVEGIRKNNHDAVTQARMLMARDPEKTVALIEERLKVVEDVSLAESFLYLVEKNRTPSGNKLLGRILVDGRFLTLRVRAARALGISDPRGLPAMLDEWEAWRPSGKNSGSEGNNPRELIEFLGRSNSPEAIRALAERFGELSPGWRIRILETICAGPYGEKGASEASRHLREALAAKALDDREVYWGASQVGSDFQYASPRVCDLALAGLISTWPNKYHLSWRGTRVERDEEIAKARNIWRMANNLPALPISERKVPLQPLKDPDTIVEIRWQEGATDLPLQVGKKLTVENLLKALAVLESDPAFTEVSVAVERLEDRKGVVATIETKEEGTEGKIVNRQFSSVGPDLSSRSGDLESEMRRILAVDSSRSFGAYIICKRMGN